MLSGLCSWNKELFLSASERSQSQGLLPAFWSCCSVLAPKRDPTVPASQEFEPSCETRTSLGENQGSVCVSSLGISIVSSAGDGMPKAAPREPYSVVEAHRQHSGRMRSFPTFREKLRPISQAPENVLFPKFRVVQCREGKRGNQGSRVPAVPCFVVLGKPLNSPESCTKRGSHPDSESSVPGIKHQSSCHRDTVLYLIGGSPIPQSELFRKFSSE